MNKINTVLEDLRKYLETWENEVEIEGMELKLRDKSGKEISQYSWKVVKEVV